MEDILNKIIEIDKKARDVIDNEKDKKQNMEEYVENEFKIKKEIIEKEYKERLNKEKDKYNNMFETRKSELDEQLRSEVEKLTNSYKEKESQVIQDIIASIISEEE